MSENLAIEIIVPVIPVYKPESELGKYVKETLVELCSLSGDINFSIVDLGNFSAQITVNNKLKVKTVSNRIDFGAIVFRFMIPNNWISMNLESNFANDFDDEQKELIFRDSVSDELKNQVFYFLLLTNISRPGAIKTLKGEVNVNNVTVFEFPSISSVHRESLPRIKEIEWPEYRTLSIERVWKWFNDKKFSFDRVSKSKIERGLNAFSHLFAEERNSLIFDLFWSLAGIEAIYCSSNTGISHQIFEKSQLLLGEIKSYKSKLSTMYNFRSRFIHGDLNIPPYGLQSEYDETYHSEEFESSILAVAILTATLQELVISNKSKLDFGFKIL